MAGFLRHFWALSLKNFINWRRTWIGSSLEIILPIVIIYLVALSHKFQNPINKEMQTYLHLATAQYPVTEPKGIRYIASQNMSANLSNFLSFANITQKPYDFYRRNPNYFWPEHCYGRGTNNKKYWSIYNRSSENPNMAQRPNLTAIAYIQENNQVEFDVLAQLKIIIGQQQIMSPGLYHQYKILKFNTKQEIFDYVRDPQYAYDDKKPGICFGFDIKKFSDSRFVVELLFNDQYEIDKAGAGIPNQGEPVWDPINPQTNIGAFNKYMNGGYSFLQNLIANAILRQSVIPQNASIAMITVPQNQQPYKTDPLIAQVLIQYLPYAMLIAYFLPVFRTCQRMVAEKETQVRDSMRMMGLNEFAYWCSWLANYLVINFIIASCSTIILFSTIFTHSSWVLVWLFFFLYGLALFGFVVMIQAFFQNTTYSSIFTLVLYTALFFVGDVVKGQYVPEVEKMWSGLIPQVTLSLMVPNLGAFESAGIGLTTQNCGVIYKNFVFSRGYWLLIVDFFIYSVAGIYLDNVIPRQTGMQRPFSYMFSYFRASYWDFFELFTCNKRQKGYKFTNLRNSARRRAELESHDPKFFETKFINPENFEVPDVALLEMEKKRRFLKIENLRKVYSNGQYAVNGINVRMYEGQIFALLGHNGAGKSSTLKILTGMVQPSEGEAYVYGYKVFSQDMDTLRRYMGVCPQHNVLFDLLTPREAIEVFQEFKGAVGTKQGRSEEVSKLLKDVGIWEFRNTQCGNLSGGNKRKLSVAIALCGQSRFVMLDEPTAGMDLQARRNLWNMLRAYRNDRIIILTTHYMDEADILGDRIGIMQDGKLVTVGSSLFLKKRYGAGYNLTVVKQQDNFDILTNLNFLRNNLGSNIEITSQSTTEVVFKISAEYSADFGNFFTKFDASFDKLGISGYGIAITSLEDVFLKVGKEEDKSQSNDEISNEENFIGGTTHSQLSQRKIDRQKQVEDYSILNQKSSFNLFSNIKAMIFKRVKLEQRRWKQVLFSEVLIPVLFFLVGIAITQMNFLFDSPSRTLSTNIYPLQQRTLVNQCPVIPSNHTSGLCDQGSIQTVIQNLPTTYTLLNNADFNVTYKNYTTNSSVNVFQQFNEDTYDMRNQGQSEPFRFGSYLFYQADLQRQQYKVINYVNTTSQDSAAALPQFMYEAILRTATNNSNFQFKMTTTGLPISQRYKDQAKQTSTIALISVVAIGLSLIPANIIGGILHEKERKLKHLQVISGQNLFAYHSVNLAFDIIKAEFIVLVCCSTFFMFGLAEYYWSLVIIAMWPFSIIPFTHASAFLFSKEWTAQFFTILVNLFCMLVLPVIVSTYLFNVETTLMGENINKNGLFLPPYVVSKAMILCGYNEQLSRFRIALGGSKLVDQNVWSNTNLTLDLIAIAIHFAVWSTLTFTFEFLPFQQFNIQAFIKNRILKKNSNSLQLSTQLVDEDVQAEEKRVCDRTKDELQVRVSMFNKVYHQMFNTDTVAVQSASFGLQYGECFALLGVNGAGKTTTFKCLTNEVKPTAGEVSIGGFDVSKQFDKARKLIGFCPQENVIFDQLSVEEHLQFFSQLKGIISNLRQSVINHILREMNLEEQRDKQAGSLSGGNKRKLQVAIAIIGNPPIILLDEPSAGMDPEARRSMWSVISRLIQKREKCAVILTTHSMEEAEALSTRMGIMVAGGQFKCFGSAQHIKNKFGTGYEIEIKIKPFQASDLVQLLGLFKISEFITKIPLQEAIDHMKLSQFPEELLAEIRQGGLGDELVRESKFDKIGNVRISNLMEWVHNIKHGMRVVRMLAKEFSSVTLLEQYQNYFKIRVLRQNNSIGSLFGMLESKKIEFGISEYSVSQTTLEQIFQLFANSSRADIGTEDNTKLTFEYTSETLFELRIIPNRQII